MIIYWQSVDVMDYDLITGESLVTNWDAIRPALPGDFPV
jgi:hypothetical protein